MLSWLDPRRGMAYTHAMAQQRRVEFKGTMEEAFAITAAISRVCKNTGGAGEGGDRCVGVEGTGAYHRCAAHEMMFEEQTMNRLLFVRWMAADLLTQEFKEKETQP